MNLEGIRNNAAESQITENNKIRRNNNNQINSSINDYGLFPFMNEGLNYDLGNLIKKSLIYIDYLKNFKLKLKFKI